MNSIYRAFWCFTSLTKAATYLQADIVQFTRVRSEVAVTRSNIWVWQNCPKANIAPFEQLLSKD